MTNQPSRRDIVRGGLALAGLGMLGIPEWALPALAQGETLVPFTDLPATVNPCPAADRRIIDIRKIDGVVHAARSVLHDAALRPSRCRPGDVPPEGLGPGEQAESLSLDELQEDEQHRPRRRLRVLGQPASAAGSRRATAAGPACRCKTVLDTAGVKADAREFVFFGADHGEEDVEFRGRSTRSTSSSAAACRARRRCRPSRSSPTR